MDEQLISDLTPITALNELARDVMVEIERVTPQDSRRVSIKQIVDYMCRVFTTKTSSYVITDETDDDNFSLNGSSAVVPITLPTLAANLGRELTFSCINSTNTVSIDGEGSETICGITGAIPLVAGQFLSLRATPTGWVFSGGNFNPGDAVIGKTLVVKENLEVTGTITAGSFTGVLKIIGSSTGDPNVSKIEFYESNGTTLSGFIGETNISAPTFFVNASKGALQLNSATGYGIFTNNTLTIANGNLTLNNGVITGLGGSQNSLAGPLKIKTNSPNALDVQTTAGTSVFNVNTLTGEVTGTAVSTAGAASKLVKVDASGNTALPGTLTTAGLLTVSDSGITSSSASVDILKPVKIAGSTMPLLTLTTTSTRFGSLFSLVNDIGKTSEIGIGTSLSFVDSLLNRMYVYSNTADGLNIMAASGKDIRFYRDLSNESARMFPSGNWGIGTTTDNGVDTLQVTGSTKITGALTTNGSCLIKDTATAALDIKTDANISVFRVDTVVKNPLINEIPVLDQTVIQSYEDTFLGKSARTIGTNLRKVGVIIPIGTAGAFDDDMVESPCVWFDVNKQKYRMVYTAYKDTGASVEASVGSAESDDLITWAKSGQKFTKSGTVGADDEFGATGPVIWYENGTYYLIYIGLNQAGYEGGVPKIMLAKTTNSDLTGWTRLGTKIAPNASFPWRASKVWHVSVVKRKGTYYLFFNATGSDTLESIGYATATSIEGTWTVQDSNSPVVDHSTSGFDSDIAGDPSVYYANGLWYMAYFGYNGTTAADGLAWTTDALFPLGWTKYSGNPILLPTPGTEDEDFAHKPYIYNAYGKQFHYYTAVDTDGGSGGESGTELRQIALAMDDGLNLRGGRYATNKGQDLLIGDALSVQTITGRTKVVFGKRDGDTELILGQDGTHNLVIKWDYNATPGSANASIAAFGGNNGLWIQGDGGYTKFGGDVELVNGSLIARFVSACTDNGTEIGVAAGRTGQGTVTGATFIIDQPTKVQIQAQSVGGIALADLTCTLQHLIYPAATWQTLEIFNANDMPTSGYKYSTGTHNLLPGYYRMLLTVANSSTGTFFSRVIGIGVFGKTSF